MSWDISIQDLPADVQSVGNISNDYRPRPLGTRDELIQRIQQLVPQVDFSDPSWGMLDDSEFSIEFNMGSEEICHGFMLHVRGGGSPIATISRLLQHLNVRAIDCQTGDFFSPEVAQASLRQWQAYRDRVIREKSSSDDNETPAA
jgi:hypothetical protein